MFKNKTTTSPKQIADQSQILYWSSLGHYVVCVSLEAIILALWLMHALAFSPGAILLWLIPVYFLLSVMGLTVSHSFPQHARRFNFLVLAGSFIIVSAIVQFTGANHNEFLFLYIIPIINAALLSTRFSILTTLAAVAMYAGIEYLEELSGTPSGSFEGGLNEVRHIGLLALIGIVVSFQTRYYISRIEKTEEALVEAKDQFLFRTVHDIRSPSTAIKFISEKYQKAAVKKKYPEIAEDIGLIREQTQRILDLVKDLLGAVEDERPSLSLNLSSVDVQELNGKLLESLKPVWKPKKIKISHLVVPDLPEVKADLNKLSEVFTNLIENAVKYNKAFGQIEISYKASGGKVSVEFYNPTPKPISEETVSKLFTPFFRDPPSPKITGTGLGLFICKKLVEKMKGAISAKSAKDGLAIEISLPKSK
ncbi:MAG: sensor histidine kinase [Acidobacteriaceae bacterium]